MVVAKAGSSAGLAVEGAALLGRRIGRRGNGGTSCNERERPRSLSRMRTDRTVIPFASELVQPVGDSSVSQCAGRVPFGEEYRWRVALIHTLVELDDYGGIGIIAVSAYGGRSHRGFTNCLIG